MNYKATANELMEKIRSYQNDDNAQSWKLLKKHDDICVYARPSKDFSGTQYKIEGDVHAPPDVVFEYIDPVPENSKRMVWDKNMKSVNVVETIDDTMSVIKVISCSAAGGLISARDFIDLVVTQISDGVYSTNGVTIDHPNCPEDRNYVRGHNYPCCLTCMPVPGEPKKTRMRNYLQPDLKGMLPRTLVETAFPSSQVEFFKNLRAKLAEDGQLSSPH